MPASARSALPAAMRARARAVRIAVFDVDGIMTDGRIYFGPRGEEMKVFHVLDGHGLKMLAEAGIELAILSGRKAACVELRAAELGIRHVVQGASDKLSALGKMIEPLGITTREVAYMGDDIPDLPVLERCGVAFSVPDAPPEVRRKAHYVTRRGGGFGAVREACEVLMRLRRAAAPRAGERR